jgi:hypothetical protein
MEGMWATGRNMAAHICEDWRGLDGCTITNKNDQYFVFLIFY